MTQMQPNLQLNRLIIAKDGAFAYDEKFHSGVNIIRGEIGRGNSVGKSTIADFIFFGLGGDKFEWKEEAGLCDHVILEANLSGSVLTLRRAITTNAQQAMDIFFGSIEESLNSAIEGWSSYPYKRYGDKESFSQVLFRMLGLPDVPGEAGANITMHQILRLMYVDQMTPVDRIFRLDPRDSTLIRQAVGDLLCGLFENELYPTQLKLRDQEAAFETVKAKYTVLSRLVDTMDEEISPLQVAAKATAAKNEIENIRAQIQHLKSIRYDKIENQQDSELALQVRKSLSDRQSNVTQLQDKVREISFEIEDATLLIESIEDALSKFVEGAATSKIIGRASFSFCPSCFALITEAEHLHHCHLCKEAIDESANDSRFARIRNELEVQLKESKALQSKRQHALSETRQDLKQEAAERDLLSRQILDLSRNYISETESEIDLLNTRLGYLDRELKDVDRQNAVIMQLQDLSKLKADLNQNILKLQDLIVRLKDQRDRKQSVIYSKISKLSSEILSKDIRSEKEFTENSYVSFDFGSDRISVNNKTGYSASSLTMIRNSFHLALHLASCNKKDMRYPRFLLMDNIEDKGMTQERSQNFQQEIVDFAEKIDCRHQIIFTTSMINPDIDMPIYTVGEAYNFENKTLKFAKASNIPSIFLVDEADDYSEYDEDL